MSLSSTDDPDNEDTPIKINCDHVLAMRRLEKVKDEETMSG